MITSQLASARTISFPHLPLVTPLNKFQARSTSFTGKMPKLRFPKWSDQFTSRLLHCRGGGWAGMGGGLHGRPRPCSPCSIMGKKTPPQRAGGHEGPTTHHRPPPPLRNYSNHLKNHPIFAAL